LPDHPSAGLLAAYFQRRLRPAQLLALDDHVTQCGKCRERLREIVSADYALVSLRNSVERDAASDDHLSPERLLEYVEDRMDTIDRELAASHIGACKFCRWLAGQLAASDRHSK
jgi:anti-sigma factor RsiW